MTLAAEAPDLDVFWGFKGPVDGFAHHRGFTHSFLGLMLTSAVVTGFMYLIWRLRGRKTNIPNLPPRWGLLFGFAYLAGLSHILLDYTNNYGVRPFWPFWEKWYSWNVAFIAEPPMWLLLLCGLILPVLFTRSKRPPMRPLFARVALLCVVLLWAVRFYKGTGIVGTLKRQTYNAEAPFRASAYPYWITTPNHFIAMRWSGVVETRSAYVVGEVNPSTGRFDPAEMDVIAKPPQTPAILAAERSYLGRVYLDWAGYPLVTEDPRGDDTVVYFRDLRFGYSRLRRNSVLAAHVTLDRNLNVIGEAMGRREQKPPLD